MDRIVQQLRDSYYRSDLALNHLRECALPSRNAILQVLSEIRDLLFPDHRLTRSIRGEESGFRIGGILEQLHDTLRRQIFLARTYSHLGEEGCPYTPEQADTDARAFLEGLPALRERIAFDVQAALDGDPAAKSADEVIFCYPGFSAIVTYRIAHELHRLDIPLLPRIMCEYAHSRTGTDIHPGATIGRSFFIDHATGVVIGETTVIGEHVKLYQGVTLGALSFPRDAEGRLLRNTKRHPTIEDDVVIYAGATVLGGETTIGRGSVIGGSCWVTRSVPPGTKVLLQEPQMKFRGPQSEKPQIMEPDWVI